VKVERERLDGILGVESPPSVDAIEGVTCDSRLAGQGVAFVAVPGFKRDGAEFAAQAVENGAPLVVAEREIPGIPAAVVPDAREALAHLACAVYGEPSSKISAYGVTGTNGKTTTAYVLHAILSAAFGEERLGLVSTSETVYGGKRHPAVRTTPEAPEVQRILARMLECGVERAVMEVSSHGVALKRIYGMRFSGAIFTNLSRDHLDLHGSMEEYYRAKRALFEWADGPKLANADDEWGRRLSGEIEGVITFGQVKTDYRIQEEQTLREGARFTLSGPRSKVELRSPLPGGYNVLNVAGAAAFALELGIGDEIVKSAMEGMVQVPGRFQRVASGCGFEVVVDYAHTEVGLKVSLEAAREMAGEGRVICVFGAAGDRDVAKRPLMGQVASKLADLAIVTTDDAYSEDPEKIAREVAAGAHGGSRIILDRREAIRWALEGAGVGDVVLVAGKGHERVQHLPAGDVPFQDATVIEELLTEREDFCRGKPETKF
jgi:UDP-N-acetylmuramoyl-L-alanyl-D-glutamate--2,6-diaminopimelate ligase